MRALIVITIMLFAFLTWFCYVTGHMNQYWSGMVGLTIGVGIVVLVSLIGNVVRRL